MSALSPVDVATLDYLNAGGWSLKACLEAVQANGDAIKHIPEEKRTAEVCLAAVANLGDAVLYLSDAQRTPDVCLAAVMSSGNSVRHLSADQLSEKICLAAVSQNGQSIYFLHQSRMTPSVCLAAVQQNGMAIQSVHHRKLTPEVCLAAVKQNPKALIYARFDISPLIADYISENKSLLQEELSILESEKALGRIQKLPEALSVSELRPYLTGPEIEKLLANVVVLKPDSKSRVGDEHVHFSIPSGVRERVYVKSGYKPGSVYPSIRVQVGPELLQVFDEMIYGSVTNIDRNYFVELIQRGDGEFALFVKYNSILGSRFVGMVPDFVVDSMTEKLVSGVVHAFGLEAPTDVKSVEPLQSIMTDVELFEQLSSLVVGAESIHLPLAELSRYADIKKMMQQAGGKYKSPSKGLPARFDFPSKMDVGSMLSTMLGGNVVNIKKETQFFATPKEAGQKLLDRLLERTGDLSGRRVLEPEAGQAALADLARDAGASVVAIENWAINADVLRSKGYDPIERDFLEVLPDDTGLFDAVLMNPPFTGRQDIAHVRHALSFIHEQGHLEAIVSTSFLKSSVKDSVNFRELCEFADCDQEILEAGTFKESGTTVPTVMLSFDMERLLNRLQETGEDGSRFGLDLKRQWEILKSRQNETPKMSYR